MTLRALTDLSPADWFIHADADAWNKICLGPPGYQAYARLDLVPADEDDEVDLTRITVHALRRILPGHTGSADDCYFAQWHGSGWEPPLRPAPAMFSLMEELAPGVRHSLRDYHLFRGTLEDSSAWDGGDPPHLMWPADHAWFVAKDVDPDWVGIGGTQALIDEVLAAPGLDATPSAYDAHDWESR
jgi:hypothetical protein